MHIRNVRDKRRLMIKSADAVLFGPPQSSSELEKHIDRILKLKFGIENICRNASSPERHDFAFGFISFDRRLCLRAFSPTTNSRKHENHVARTRNSAASRRKSSGRDWTVKCCLSSCFLKTKESFQHENSRLRRKRNKSRNQSDVARSLVKRGSAEQSSTMKIERKCPNFGFSFSFVQEEADRFRQRRNSSIDHEKQLNLALQEIEQVRRKKFFSCFQKKIFLFQVTKCASTRWRT